MSLSSISILGEADFWTKLWLRTDAASEGARAVDSMYLWLWWFCVVWFVGLMGLMAYFVVKYRRRPGKIAPRSASHNTTIELAWTIIPTLFLAYIFFRGFHGYMNRMTAPGDVMQLNLTAWKWSWKIEYPNGYETTSSTTIGARPVPVFYLPAGRDIRFKMNSNDVMHAFWIPDLRIKQDVIPNRYTTLAFKFDAPPADAKLMPRNEQEAAASKVDYIKSIAGEAYSDHWVFCAEYCGTEHSEMAAIIRVVSPDAFERWLPTIGEDTLPLLQLGQVVYRGKCASCHTVDGSANTGPTWKDLYGNESEYTDGSKKLVNAAHVMDSVRNPAKFIRKGFGNNMTPWSQSNLSDRAVQGVIEYMKTLSTHADKAGDPPAEAPAGGK